MYKQLKKIIISIIVCVVGMNVSADDIDIIMADKLYDSNILFIMDLSGSMNYGLNYNSDAVSGDPTRLEELTGAFNDIINDTQFDDINIGLATFSGPDEGKGKGHGITYPVKPLTGTTAQSILNSNSFFNHSAATSYMPAATATMETREYLAAVTSDTSLWSSDGSTPIVDALYEAALYFRSGEVDRGNFVPTDNRSAHPSSYNGDVTTGTVSTPNASCDVADRKPCTCGVNCGISENSSTGPGYVNSSTDTGGCTANPPGTYTCSTSDPACGTDPSCVAGTPDTVYCEYEGVSLCETNNPTYENCEKYKKKIEYSNSEGETEEREEKWVRCEQPTQVCNASPSFSCPTTVTSCTKCKDTVTEGKPAYISPIIEACPKNGIILLTDGKPTSNNVSSSERSSLMGSSSCARNDYDGDGDDDLDDDGRCGPEIAEFLATTDHADGTVGSSTKIPDLSNDNGIQNVKTYTVGLSLSNGTEIAYMKDIADKGQGAFVNTSTRAELTEAFVNAITGIVGKTRSFASPTYSIDTSTLLSHGESVYVPLFDRKGAVWPGNLKKFKMVNGVLLDNADNPATDANGNLLPDAKDLWSIASSTGELKSGGAANKLPIADDRKIYTDVDISSYPATLSNSAYSLSIGNVKITESMLGATTPANRDQLIDFIRGKNSDGTKRNHMGDIIHSKPVQLVKDNAGTEEKYIFVGTNEGYLHAINDSDGSEAFAFMPEVLLENIKPQFQGAATAKHIYGVDGPLTLWLDESANYTSNYHLINNGVLDANEKAYLVFGLRRGGKSYYMLDVSIPATPKLVWKINSGDSDFKDLGHSWSEPVIASLKWGSNTAPKPVMIFGGGYNEAADGSEAADGNIVYIVDALTGDHIWDTDDAKAVKNKTLESIEHAVPARIRVLDVDRNGSIDRLYFGDTGANIWRVDLNAAMYNSDPKDDSKIAEATLYKIAKLGKTGTDLVDRKFFEEPDVAIFRRAGKFVATIAIGSGNRTKPLDIGVDDKFFVIYDKEVMYELTKATVTIDELNTSFPITSTELAAADFKGWSKDLATTGVTGEKVLSTAVTYQNKVLFTTFGITAITTPDACSPSNTNQARLYIMDLINGNEDTNIEASNGEILGTPQIIFDQLQDTSGGDCTTGDCVRKVKVRVGKAGPYALPPQAAGVALPDALPRVYWFKNQQ